MKSLDLGASGCDIDSREGRGCAGSRAGRPAVYVALSRSRYVATAPETAASVHVRTQNGTSTF